MAKKIVITSGKGGVGKTTITANLGVMLSKLGKRVVLVDVDFGLNNLDVVLGVETLVVFDILDVLEGRCRPKQALIEHNIYKNLYVLPSDKLKTGMGISGQNLKLITESFNNICDYILLDCPAGIDVGFHRALSCADEAIIVATPNLTSLRDASKVVSIIKSYRLDNVSLVVNKVRGDLIVGKKMILPTDMQEVLKTKLLGVLPEEDFVFLSIGKNLPKSSDSYKAYKILAENVLYGKSRIYDATSKYMGFFGSIRRGMKGSL